MRRLKHGAAALGLALLGLQAARADEAAPRPVAVQYGGPMMGGPGYGMPPDFDPDMDPGFGPGMEEGYGPGPGRRAAPRRRPHRASGPFTTYHGFKIDLGDAQGRIDVRSAIAEVERQIDIVDRAGLGPSLLGKFRAVPIRISASLSDGGSHYSGGSEVTLGSLRPGDTRPVLLHEYMHVLEYRTFPGGLHNSTVRRFYDEAQARGLYPPDAYMMSNPAEFFAVTASCYLNGTVARDPYTRAAIRQRQPDYYAYLAQLFGPRLEAAGTAVPRAVASLR